MFLLHPLDAQPQLIGHVFLKVAYLSDRLSEEVSFVGDVSFNGVTVFSSVKLAVKVTSFLQ